MARKTPLNSFISKLSSKFLSKTEEPPQKDKRISPPSLRLVFVIIDWTKIHVVSKIFEDEKVRFHYISRGRGTASSDILNVLGIGASDKAVIMCLEQAVMVSVLIKEIRKKLLTTQGAGIAFTVPLSGINTPMLQVFKKSIHTNEKLALEINAAGNPDALQQNVPNSANRGRRASDKEGRKMSKIDHDLIVAIINQGYSDEFMVVARTAGAAGGTVLSARGSAHEGPVKAFGLSVQDEREIILLLTSREKRIPIMKAVSLAYGITSKAEGIIFSLPVDFLEGLNVHIE